MTINFTVAMNTILICLIASGLGAFAYFAASSTQWLAKHPYWCWWIGVFVALLVFAVLTLKGG